MRCFGNTRVEAGEVHFGVNPSKGLLVMAWNGATPNGYTVNVFSCYFYCQDLSHLMSHKSCECVCGYSSMPVSLCVFMCLHE